MTSITVITSPYKHHKLQSGLLPSPQMHKQSTLNNIEVTWYKNNQLSFCAILYFKNTWSNLDNYQPLSSWFIVIHTSYQIIWQKKNRGQRLAVCLIRGIKKAKEHGYRSVRPLLLLELGWWWGGPTVYAWKMSTGTCPPQVMFLDLEIPLTT